MISRIPLIRSSRPALLLGVALAAFTATTTGAEESRLWRLAPYRVRAVLAFEGPSVATDRFAAETTRVFEQDVRRNAGSLWRLETEPAGLEARVVIAEMNDSAAGSPDWSPPAGPDKTWILSVRETARGVELMACEYDHTLLLWGAPVREEVVAIDETPIRLSALTRKVFARLARFDLDSNDSSQVRLAYRGASMAGLKGVRPEAGSGVVFKPFLQKTDRNGVPLDESTQPTPWTYLLTLEPPADAGESEPSEGDAGQSHSQSAKIYSNSPRPFGARRRGGVEQIALAAHGDGGQATLRLVTKDAAETPLPGYTAIVRDEATRKPVPIGVSNSLGEITITGDEPVIRVFLVAGDQTVAILPVAPGVDHELLVRLPDERPRLTAKIKLSAIEESLIDQVAQRKLLEANIRSLIEEDALEEADRQMQNYDALPGRPQFNRMIDSAEQQCRSKDPHVQRRVDRMFEDARAVLAIYLDARASLEIKEALSQAHRQASSPANSPAPPAGE
ncbi:hypothetical protein Mal64_04050 [Pseudobythopirellula maris]|uniref:Uncharacterized protein n=1 Tax=Pseudobythopirellula maris TaxID=2527991 RepID=A0A5C5ZR45_9BACT|nr:hypothetical protein [Pseudobythopirellula maris]TWT90022.1 hypothetical protein Mal64_04050 [Pseudobythopirellula maris]